MEMDEGSKEKENFRTLIEGDKIGNVEDRLNIIDAFLSLKGHITLPDMMKLLKERGYEYDEAFVRDCMNRWVEYGFAQKKEFDGQPPMYEHRYLGRHHDHIICTKCGKIVEFRDEIIEEQQLRIASKYGFHMLQHKMEIYGLCSECLSQRKPIMPLSMAKSGERVIIKQLRGGKEFKMRIMEMGFRIGDEIEVINNNHMGRMIIGKGNTRFALGRGMAEKIYVSSIMT